MRSLRSYAAAFTIERLVERSNSDLAHGIGNLVQRVTSIVHKLRPEGVVTATDTGVLPAVRAACAELRELLQTFDRRGAADVAIEAVAIVNQELERSALWKVAPGVQRDGWVEQLLDQYLATVQLIGISISPIVPTLAARVAAQLDRSGSLPPPQRTPCVTTRLPILWLRFDRGGGATFRLRRKVRR